MRRHSPWRIAAGLLAIAALAVLSLLIPRWGAFHQRAVVEAGRTFRLSSERSGSYDWTLREGSPARGQGTVEENTVQFRRAELVQMRLAEDLANGVVIREGQVLASFHSPRVEASVEELRALRDSLVADQALLASGARPEEIQAARAKLELAEATRAGEQPQLERVRTMAAEGLVTEAELDAAELLDEMRALEIELARAEVAVARSSARPEALASLDAQIAAADARIADLEILLDEYVIRSPIDGILEVGGGRRGVLRVYDIDVVYLRIPIPQAHRHRVEAGDPVTFRTPADPGKEFGGTIVDMGENALNLNGQQIFWGSAEIANPGHRLRSGMTGEVELEIDGGRGSLVGSLWRDIMGYGQ
ncbi:MAG: hypothetical protein QGH45_01410 [Myxococcota bacterium]|nr:hypothetical protein [Myxococcota bacterium]